MLVPVKGGVIMLPRIVVYVNIYEAPVLIVPVKAIVAAL
jgi:hypothetical protein